MDCAPLKDPAESSTSTKEADWPPPEVPAESLLSTTEPVNPPVKSKGRSKGRKVKPRGFKGISYNSVESISTTFTLPDDEAVSNETVHCGQAEESSSNPAIKIPPASGAVVRAH